MVETWDDYEEGTEVETGISNCLSDSSFILQQPVGSNLTFNFDIYDGTSTPATFPLAKNTIGGFNVWATGNDPGDYSQAGTAPASACHYTLDNPIKANCTINLANFSFFAHGAVYYLVVQAVGMPMITNHISNNRVQYLP